MQQLIVAISMVSQPLTVADLGGGGSVDHPASASRKLGRGTSNIPARARASF